MSDYTVVSNWSAMDGLISGALDKIFYGVDWDSEYSAIQTAIATKIDDTDVASQAEAEAATATNKVMTPLRMAQYADLNAGALGDLQALTDPGGDRLFGWDDSASAVVGMTLGSGLVKTAGLIVNTIEPDFSVFTTEATIETPDMLAVYDADAGTHKKLDVENRGGALAGGWNNVLKELDESVTSSTTLQDDDELTVTLDASSTYIIVGLFYVTAASSTPDMRLSMSFSTAPTAYHMTARVTTDVGSFAGDSSDGTYSAAEYNFLPLSNTHNLVHVYATITTDAASTTATFAWAQNSNSVDAVTMKAGSSFRYVKVS